ncbi:MAG: hypothetical protein LBU11_12360 [Zoogloeaceae bacterium]|jgi:hypothetical protein|nr:hypothetical protein [Zoogloeaceae bacterium]
MSNVKFGQWFDEQKRRGLVDIKFSIAPSQTTTVDNIKNAILAAEDAIAKGELRAAPAPAPIPDDSVAKTLRAIRLDA